MSYEFLFTSLIVVLLPGAGVIYTVSTGLFEGWRASIAAAFLEAFVEEERPFAHLDIAGATLSTGAGGFGTKVLLHIVKNI